MNKKLIFIIPISLAGIIGIYLIIKNIPHKTSKAAPNVASARQLFDLARVQETDNELLLAKATYRDIINNYPNYPQVQDVQKKIEDLNMKIILSPTLITPNSSLYEVKPGDSLIKIAKEFNTTVELITKINMLKSGMIRPKMKLKVWTGKFSVLVDKSQNILMLKSDGEIIKTYTVSTGKNNSTPVGTFKIKDKIINPPWFKPGHLEPIPAGNPENILGTRWMGFDLPSYGIHGTTEPQTLGQQITDGCVRMKNEEVEELFSLLPPDTEAVIID
ncbi:MAG: L,D-transpeptidase family protein [Candidatus Omnitrophota bacterium]|nr:L,D-transpeptidase family protein [Candidatus Omnitrophota bacterium]